jgi:hypothetical protein
MYFIFFLYMDELSQILEKEESNKEKLAAAERRAKLEIEQKEKEFKEEFLKKSVLTASEKAGLLAEKKKETEKISQAIKEKLEKELNVLEKINKKKALEHIIKKLC